jgi:hypothetical protein
MRKYYVSLDFTVEDPQIWGVMTPQIWEFTTAIPNEPLDFLLEEQPW